MSRFDGDTDEDRALWHTYFGWARDAVRDFLPVAEPGTPQAISDAQESRLRADEARALQAIVFTAFMLEYRLKRVLGCFGVSAEGVALEDLLRSFWARLRDCARLDGRGKCRQPAEWRTVAKQLRELVTWRNRIAHGSYAEIVKWKAGQRLEKRAVILYCAVVKAMKLLNVHTGRDARSEADVDAYFQPTMFRPASEPKYASRLTRG